MAFVPPARHLLRAKDLADARYVEPLTSTTWRGAAGLSRAHFSREFRRAFGESPHAYLLTRRLERAAALLRDDRPLGRRHLLRRSGCRASARSRRASRARYGLSPTAYRAAFPPASAHALVPACIVRAYGRPQRRTFREDSGARRA